MQLHIDVLEFHQRQFLDICNVVENKNLALAVVKDQRLLHDLNCLRLLHLRLIFIVVLGSFSRAVTIDNNLCGGTCRLHNVV